MRKLFFPLLALVCFVLSSCDADEGKLPNISFKTGDNYISTTTIIEKDSTFTIGINASKAEDRDVLKQFNISKSVNGGTPTTVFSKSLSGAEGDKYSYDYTSKMDAEVGQIVVYTFTVTNRDGLVNQVQLALTSFSL